jgi:acyl transferase domain-containing protein/NADPH:quinone reductase-like Zn-dependent oxidoreductase/ubiquinone/menaquinone biosynthesis C-methylase UbiE
LVWSAPDRDGTKRLSTAYQDYLARKKLAGSALDDLVYSLVVKRSNFSWRSFAVVNSPDTHDTAAAVMISNPVRRTTNPNVAFIFTGQGSQYLGMGRRLISLPVFRGSLENCEEYLGDFGCKWSLLEKLSGVSTNPQIDSPGYSQPLVTCLQIALVDLFQSLGVVPSIVIGHSSGEIAAAYASGALSKSSAVKVAYYRGIMSAQLVSFVKDTAMMAVGISRENVEAYLSRLRTLEPIMEVSIGCVNSPQSITLTGDTQQLRTLEAWLNADGVFNRKLRVPIAYHSRFMEAFAVEYSLALNKLDSGRSSGFLPMISSVTKDIVPAAELVSAEYWVRNLTSTVEFEAAFAKLLAYASHKPRNQLGKRLGSQSLSITHILEVGPHTTLQGPIRDNLNLHVGTKPEYIASLVRKQDALVSIQKALGTLFCAGFTVDILAVNTLQDIPRLPPPDMPRYPFNHALTYWRESSLSRNFRFRQNARHELLGTRSLDWNAQIAQWRNIVRISELPWLEDHKIGTNVVFPAAGMIAIAIEAIRQLIGAAAPLCGFHIQHTSFMHAISFSRDQPQVETQLTLSRPSLAKDEQEWSQFRLFVLENRSYMECCSGWIRPVANAKDRDRVMAAWSWCCRDTPRDWIDKVNTACSGAEKDPYDMISGTEVRYGPAFQNLEGMHVGPRGEVKARINTETWKLGNRSLLPPSFAIHPTTLDGLAQPLLQALLAQRPDGLPTMVPIRVSQIWVACPASQLHSERIDVAAKCAFSGHRGGKADIIATAPDATFPLVFMQGLETSFISSNEKFDGVLDKTSRNLCTKLEWKPDVESLTSDQLLSYCTRERPKQLANTVQSHRLLLTTILCFVEDALAYVDQHPEVVPDGHLKAYVAWMQYQQQRLRLGRSLVTDDSVQHLLQSPDARERANREVEESGIDGLFFIQTGRKLLQMLRGELDPLEFMFGEGLADRYYEKMLANDHHAYPASEYIDLLCFKNPSMKILEVGAGTGGQTLRLIEAMSRDGVNKWKQYDYTDISPRFFSGAREKFRGHLDHMAFRVCDISRDPVAQGFEANSYDLVVASHVLHATEDLQQTLSNIHKLLKPNGKLLFFETTLPDAIPVGFSFGLLKGWWAPLEHEERAPHSPCVTTKHWNTLLKLSGFSGVDVDIPGQEEKYCRSSSILISTAESGPSEVTKTSAPILLVVDDRVQTQCVVAKTLQSLMSGSLADRCKTCTMAQLADQDSQNSPLLIFLLELDAILLGNISENDYALLQSALLRFKTILWTTRSDKQTGGEPAHHLVDGLARTLMSEDSARKFVTLSLDSFRQDAERVSKVISEAAQRVLDVQVEDVENHCIATPDGIEICRVAQDVYMDDQVAARVSPCQIQEIQLSTDTQICLRSTPGHLDTLGWQEIAQDRPGRHERLEMDEVVILVQAIGLTFADYLVAKGEITENGLAAECAGVVQEAGSTSGFKPGDQVCLLSNGAACSIVRAKASAVAHIPPQMSFVEAASIPSALWLSYQALFNSANMQEGDTVLTLQGTSCVAQMLIQLARSYGARVLVLTGSTAKSDFIRDKLAIPETDIFNTEDSTMLSKLYEATSGQGVDIIVGPLSETAYTTSDFLSSCLAPLGRIVDTSSHVSRQVDLALPPFAAWQSNVARSCVNMADLLRQRPSLVHKTFQSALKIFCAKSIRLPQPIHCFTANNVQDAFLHFEERNVIGKRVIELNATTTIIVKHIPNASTSVAISLTFI